MSTVHTVIVACALALSGCAIAPDTYTASISHVSQPMRGMGPEPIGSNGRLAETTYESVELSARWQHGKAFAETTLAYVVHDTWLTGGPWLFTARSGLQWRGR